MKWKPKGLTSIQNKIALVQILAANQILCTDNIRVSIGICNEASRSPHCLAMCTVQDWNMTEKLQRRESPHFFMWFVWPSLDHGGCRRKIKKRSKQEMSCNLTESQKKSMKYIKSKEGTWKM
jgi:hypothetical protein